MKDFGLIGYPLTHSFSKKFFTEKFQREGITDCFYNNYPIETIEQFPALIQSLPELVGLNVTIPYKELIIPYLDELEENAKEIGAVNTIKIVDGRSVGFNTDLYGFMQSMLPLIETFHMHALILGTGGSSKAVAFGLKKMGIESVFVSRNAESKHELNYNELDHDIMKQYKIIINTTPLGMYPNVDNCPPIPYEYVTTSHLFFDLIYNPGETLFLQQGKERGAKTKNGLHMLQLQAEKSWEIWME